MVSMSSGTKILSITLLIFILYGCALDENEKQFITKVDKLLEQNKNKDIEVNLSDLVDFKWNKVCFGVYPKLKLSFSGSVEDTKISMKLPREKFYINEDYVEGSPSEKCFKKEQIFILHQDIQHGMRDEEMPYILMKYKKEK